MHLKLNHRITGRLGVGAALAGVLLGGVLTAEGSGVVRMVTLLTGSQETPPVATNAFGCGVFEIDTTANTVTYRIVFTGLSSAETAAHIHGFAPPGTPAGVLHPLPSGNPKTGVWNYNEVDEADILGGLTYVNIHTSNFGGGEIRGQIVDLVCQLDGAQETPPNGSAGRGFGLFMIDTDANALSYYISYGGLGSAETAAHIHGFATHTAPAGVLHPLPAGSPKVGTWNYNEVDEAGILDGLTYVNIHTQNFGGGEIRGQITPIVAPIDAMQETPPVPSPGAAGTGLFAIDRAADVLSYDIRFAGLSSAETAAHIHGFAPPGTPAGVLHPLPAGSPKLGTWSYAAAQESGILDGMTYVNIHTVNFGGGEIRGQIQFPPPPKVDCPEDLDGDGDVDFNDLVQLLNAYGSTDDGDIDGDGDTDFNDLVALLNAYGTTC